MDLPHIPLYYAIQFRYVSVYGDIVIISQYGMSQYRYMGTKKFHVTTGFFNSEQHRWSLFGGGGGAVDAAGTCPVTPHHILGDLNLHHHHCEYPKTCQINYTTVHEV